MNEADVSATRQYLKVIADMQCQNELPCLTAIQMLLKYGRIYTERIESKWIGTPQACFANAQYLARQKRWRYVEGYATNMIPVEHAWCLNDNDQVVDPTWDQTRAGTVDYVGVILDLEFVKLMRKKLRHESYSILGAWWKWDKIAPLIEQHLEERNAK